MQWRCSHVTAPPPSLSSSCLLPEVSKWWYLAISVVLALLFSAYLVSGERAVPAQSGMGVHSQLHRSQLSAGPHGSPPLLLLPCCQVYDIQLLVGGKSVAFSPDEYVAASLQIYLGEWGGDGGRWGRKGAVASPAVATHAGASRTHGCKLPRLLKLSHQCSVALLQTWSTCSWRSSTSVGGVGVGVGGWLAGCSRSAHSRATFLQPIVQLVLQRAHCLLRVLIAHHICSAMQWASHRAIERRLQHDLFQCPNNRQPIT